MNRLRSLLFIFLLAAACGSAHHSDDLPENTASHHVYQKVSDIPVPDGFHRIAQLRSTYTGWITDLPLKSGKTILDYTGKVIRNTFYKIWAVLDRPLLFQQDLEQCADFAMRLWADFHQEAGRLEDLFLFDYSGNKKFYKNADLPYQRFLKQAFSYSNSYSLKQGCQTVTPVNLRPGDLIVQNERGGVGHVSVIMDMCTSPDGRVLFLIGYSFMPAQEFHIEKADPSYGISGWFSLEGYYRYLTDHLNMGKPVLRRFNPPTN